MGLIIFAGKRSVSEHRLRVCEVDTWRSLVKETFQISSLSTGLFPLSSSQLQRDNVGVAFRFLAGQQQRITLISNSVDMFLCLRDLGCDPEA